MKKYLRIVHERINFWNLFIGIVIGFGIGVYTLNALVPGASESIRMYRLDRASLDYDKMMRVGSGLHMMGGTMMMGQTTEKQFLEGMIVHHQAAVIMSQQVLTRNPREEVKKLANDIISSQSAEIKIMQEWLANWK